MAGVTRLLLSFAGVCLSLSLLVKGQIVDGSQIDGIRLVASDGKTGGNSGRVEVLYNGAWGTICDDSWSFGDARVACRMLGFQGAVCSVGRARFGRGSASSPIWMDELHCTGQERALDLCFFRGWGRHNCNHRKDAGVVCSNSSLIGIPSDITLLNSTTKSLTIAWTAPTAPDGISSVRYRVQIESEDGNVRRETISKFRSRHIAGQRITHTLGYLEKDTTYSVRIKMGVQYSVCGYTFDFGEYSNPVSFMTDDTLPESDIELRLIPPQPGLNFLGRLEVLYNDTWGTVCDDFFGYAEADIVCHMLNFTRGALCVAGNAKFGQGQGPIWLDNVNCNIEDEILDDCEFNPWGMSNCNHRCDVGVICRPNGPFPAVENLQVLNVGPSSISFGWDPYVFPPGTRKNLLELRCISSDGFSVSIAVPGDLTNYTFRWLPLGEQFNISVRARVQFSVCRFSPLFGEYSDEIVATTMETAPTEAPRNFAVTAINRTAIEVKWRLPPFDSRGGTILGYRLFYQLAELEGEEEEIMVNITNNATETYVVSDLEPDTMYNLSILAYTSVGDGPRSSTLTTATLRFDPMISRFGFFGNGQDRVVLSSYRRRRVRIICATKNSTDAPPDWFFSNGTRIGFRNRNLKVTRSSDGTAVLRIADYRPLSYCDGGTYTCIVNTTTSDHFETKDFTLVINLMPPPLDRPSVIKTQSMSITIRWSDLLCDGGHTIRSFTIRYRMQTYFSYFRYIRNIDPNLRNYTIIELEPNSLYSIQIRTVNTDSIASSFSSPRFVSTLPPAPLPPRNVSAKLIAPDTVEVRWSVPAVSNGVIIRYTVYAIPVRANGPTLRGKRQATTPQTIQKVFPGSARAGNITMSAHSVTYYFIVSAAVMAGQIVNEGEPSDATVRTTLFIPDPGLPMLVNLLIAQSTNSSISLMWENSFPSTETIQTIKYLVMYSGEVEWRSQEGILIQFEDHGETNVTTNSIKVSALVPGTTYIFKVSAISQSGRGAEAVIDAQTQPSQEGVAYFQLRMGPIESCVNFPMGDSSKDNVRKGLAQELTQLCTTCHGLTAANIKDDKFSCRGGLTNFIVYRARIVGTDTYSAQGLVSLMQSWVGSGRASVMVQSSRLHLDQTCDAYLDTLQSPDCPPGEQIPSLWTSPITNLEFTEMTLLVSGDESGSASGGGVIAGSISAVVVVILAILCMLLILVPVLIMKTLNSKHKHHTSLTNQDEDTKRDSIIIFDSDMKNKEDMTG